ncbi:MAG: hypothetical protein ORN57_04470 [Alphaproteobacteria bacterium]|nr:hypothetical protein [Alphaproteobacteria bacterium]
MLTIKLLLGLALPRFYRWNNGQHYSLRGASKQPVKPYFHQLPWRIFFDSHL